MGRLQNFSAWASYRHEGHRPSPIRLSRHISNHGRFGILFNVVYGPTAPKGVPLPEILTESAVGGVREGGLQNGSFAGNSCFE